MGLSNSQKVRELGLKMAQYNVMAEEKNLPMKAMMVFDRRMFPKKIDDLFFTIIRHNNLYCPTNDCFITYQVRCGYSYNEENKQNRDTFDDYLIKNGAQEEEYVLIHRY